MPEARGLGWVALRGVQAVGAAEGLPQAACHRPEACMLPRPWLLLPSRRVVLIVGRALAQAARQIPPPKLPSRPLACAPLFLSPHHLAGSWFMRALCCSAVPPADLILTYYATEAAKWMAEDSPSWR